MQKSLKQLHGELKNGTLTVRALVEQSRDVIKEKDGDNPYEITFERAVDILSKPKPERKGRWAKKKVEEVKTEAK